jgi:23S rRNA (guanosine2251-2'-O)-methyltransferase
MNKKLSMDELNRLSVQEFKNIEKIPLVIVLDNVRSMNNVGSAFRTSDAFAIEKLYLTGITAQPPHKEITKTALGADESVDWFYYSNINALIVKLKADGYTVCAIEQVENSIKLNDFQPENTKKYALVFGNEVFGVADEVIDLVDCNIEIPQFGTKHSLNISVTIGVVCWDFLQKIKFNLKT